MRPVGLCQRKNSSDSIGNRTRDLPACSAVPQPTAPPRDLLCLKHGSIIGLRMPESKHVATFIIDNKLVVF